MSLYKIMLVDDEEEVRKAIINKMNWEENGFTVVGDAENGQDALEKVEILYPDVIITDIKMPYMDGLELTEKIRVKYPSIKVIIFSGFDDFSYAKEAIRLGVTEYILKPVNVDELTGILKKVKNKLDEEVKSARDIDLIRSRYNDSLPVLREQFLNNLIMGGEYSKEEIERRLNEYGIDFSEKGKFAVCVIDINFDSIKEGLLKEKKLVPTYIKKFVEERLSLNYKNIIFNSFKGEPVIIVVRGGKVHLTDILRDICKNVKITLGVEITIGIGSESTLSEISTSYKQAVDAIGYKMIAGTGVICIQDVEPVNTGILRLDEKEEGDLISSIKFGDKKMIFDVVDFLLKKPEKIKVHSRQYQAYMLSILTRIIDLMQQYEMGSEGFDYIDIVNKIKDKTEFKDWLLKVCENINIEIKEKRETTSKQIIERAKELLLENFQNPDLSLDMVCKTLHLSPAYFSMLFKKETGQTYINYLTDIRLNKAVELLNTTEDKTYMIAEKVGYPEQNYFSYVFKKKFGVSPTKFRTKKNETKNIQ